MTKMIAFLEVKDAAKMTEEGRKEVANWLKRQAKELIKEGKDYGKHFRARYMVQEVKDE